MSDKWPKSKHQNFKSNQWFSYKIWTKNSEEPIVHLHNWPLPEQHHFFKIQWEIQFLTFLMLSKTLKKKFRTEIWKFSFQICFQNQFSTSGSGQTENTQIPIFAYVQFDHFPKSKLILKADWKWECPYFFSKLLFGAFLSVLKK